MGRSWATSSHAPPPDSPLDGPGNYDFEVGKTLPRLKKPNSCGKLSLFRPTRRVTATDVYLRYSGRGTAFHYLHHEGDIVRKLISNGPRAATPSSRSSRQPSPAGQCSPATAAGSARRTSPVSDVDRSGSSPSPTRAARRLLAELRGKIVHPHPAQQEVLDVVARFRSWTAAAAGSKTKLAAKIALGKAASLIR